MVKPPEPVRARLPEKYREALEGMRDTIFLAGQKHQAQHQIADRDDCHPEIIGGYLPTRFAEGRWHGRECRGFEPVFRRRMAALGVPMWAHCIRRTDEEQARLKAEGFSKAGPGESAHSLGCAVDFVHGTKAWKLTEMQWEVVGFVGHEVARSLGLKIVWGGDDTAWDPTDTFRWDPAHWELSGWKSLRAIKHQGPGMTLGEILFADASMRSG